jgi:hypothetical protein
MGRDENEAKKQKNFSLESLILIKYNYTIEPLL